MDNRSELADRWRAKCKMTMEMSQIELRCQNCGTLFDFEKPLDCSHCGNSELVAGLSDSMAELVRVGASRAGVSPEVYFNASLKAALMNDLTRKMSSSEKQRFERVLARCLKLL